MKKIIRCLVLISILMSCSSKNDSYEDEIKMFQYNTNRYFANAATSPLTKEDLESFKGLDYFEIDKKYRIEARIELTPNSPLFDMPTTIERVSLYKTYGIARFKLNGQTIELNIYQETSPEKGFSDYLFLPFNDRTNGKETYGGGRYIDLELPLEQSKTFIIDFNKAYNPYCAYNPNYSCPIPPKENDIELEIRAGMRNFEIKQ
jgi:uncharacterized protein (DUF1684 family)